MKIGKTGLTSIVIGLLLFNGALFLLINTLRDRRDRVQAELLSLDAEKKALDRLSYQYNQTSGKLRQLTTALPANFSEFATFIQELSTIASLSGQRITINSENQIKPDEYKTREVNTVAVEVELEGSFSEISDFFNRLYLMPYYTTVEELSIKATNEGLNTTLRLLVFMR